MKTLAGGRGHQMKSRGCGSARSSYLPSCSLFCCNRLRRKDGSVQWILQSGYALRLFFSLISNPILSFPPTCYVETTAFDQLIVNKYEPGQGIRSHVDLMSFEYGIAIISLESSCIMHFSQVPMDEQDCAANQETFNTRKVPLYLTPGSLVLMWGEARYLWEHGIDRTAGFQMWERQEIKRKRRISITLRRLCQNFTP